VTTEAPDFAALFGGPPEVVASAPGRVNLIGEHTDYNDGFVLPAAIPLRTRVEIRRRGDDRVQVLSADVPGGLRTYRLGEEARRGGWLDYVAGATRGLAARGLDRGVDLRISSGVPLGAGLSSSAALIVALLRGLREALALDLADAELVDLAHRVETEFVGAPVGVMDPFAVHYADEATALLLDTRSREFERVPLPPGLGLCVLDSGVRHRLAAQGGYRTRRAECERAAALLGVRSLRELDDERGAADLPAPLDRRVRHVVRENARVLAAAAALRSGDLAALGALFDASHRSMRDDYEVSVREVDELVAAARADPEVFGARLTGGGFGGAVVVATTTGQAAAVAARVARARAQATGRGARVLVPA
jgi:galactokinase